MKKLKRILIVLLILVVLIVVLLGLLVSDRLRFTYMVPEAEKDNERLGELIDLLADASSDEEGNIPSVIQVTVPPETVNALLRLSAYHLNGQIREEGLRCFFEWDKDKQTIRAAAAYDLPLSLEFTIRANISPSVENGVLHLPVSGFRAGYLPLPASVLDRDISGDDLKDDSLKQMLAAIHHLSPLPDGSVEIGIYPEKISSLIQFLNTQQDTPSSNE